MRTVIKDPAEEILLGFDYQDRIPSGARIISSSWSVANGLTGSNATYTDTAVEIELTSGTATNQYLVSNEVTTSGGEVYKRSFKVLVRTR